MNWSQPSDGTSSPSLPSLSPPGPAVAAVCAWASRAAIVPEQLRKIFRTLVSPAPLSPLAGWALLTAGAVAPHRAFVNLGRRVTVRIARIPKIRRLLQRKWPIWGKLLLKNKMRAEVTSYRLAINEAWEVLEGTLPPEQLAAMRQAEYSITGYNSTPNSTGAGAVGGARDARANGGGGSARDASNEGNGSRDRGSFDSDRSVDESRDSPGEAEIENETDYYGVALRGIVRSGSRNSMESSVSGGRSVATGGASRQPGSGAGSRGRVVASDASRRRSEDAGRGGGRGRHHGRGRGRGPTGAGGSSPSPRGPGPIARAAQFGRHLSHRVFVAAPSGLYGILTGREFGAELTCPPASQLAYLSNSLHPDTRSHFTRAQHAAFLLQYHGDVSRAAAAMERSMRWREKYRFVSQKDLRRFEDVVFVHGGRSAYTGGVHLCLRLSAVSAAETREGLDAVAGALMAHVEAQWSQLSVSGPTPGKLRGRLVAIVDCAGVTPGSFPASLVAHTLVTLDSNYPELAAEVHVVNVWWLVKRALTALLEATSASTRQRVRIYRNDENGAEKLFIRFAPHSLPACFPQGKCACRTCKKMVRDGNVTRHADGNRREGEFQHGGLMGRYHRWERMSGAQRRQYLRHLLFYYLGLVMFWPMHIFRLNVHPLLVAMVKVNKAARAFASRLRRGDPLAVFVASIVAFASLAFSLAVLAWWAEYGSALILQSMRDPPRNWEEAWRMRGLFQRTISSSLEKSLGLEAGTLPGGGMERDPTMHEDGGWVHAWGGLRSHGDEL